MGPPLLLADACRGWQPAIVLSNGDVASLGLCDLGGIDEGLGPQTVPALVFSPPSKEPEVITPDGLGGYDEWSIVETDTPGELAAIFRHQYTGEYYFQATSADYGRSWQGFKPSNIWLSSWPSRPTLRKMEDGTLVAFYAERKNRRIVAQPSFDGGRTWDANRRVVIMDGGGQLSVHLGEHLSIDSGYPDAAPVGDGRWLAVYYNAGQILGTYFDTSSFREQYNGVRLSRGYETTTSTLAAHWSFDEASGTKSTIVYDQVSGAYNYGKLRGGIYRDSGHVGASIRFKFAASDYIAVADSDTLRLPKFYALEAWVFSRNMSVDQAIISKAPAYSLSIQDGRLAFQTGKSTFRGKQLLPEKEWFHAGVVVKPTLDGYVKVILFVNGEIDAVHNLSINREAVDSAEAQLRSDIRPIDGAAYQEFHAGRWEQYQDALTIGIENDLINRPFDGFIDEVAIHRLTGEQTDVQLEEGSGVDFFIGLKMDYANSGVVTSPLISLEPGTLWDRFSAIVETPENTHVRFDIINGNGEVIAMNVSSGDDMSSIRESAIRLRAVLSTDDVTMTPVLKSWKVSWEPHS